MGPIWVSLEPEKERKSVRHYPTLPRERTKSGKKQSDTEESKPKEDKMSPYEQVGEIGRPVAISGKEAENYKAVLASLGYSTNLERFTVDSRGYSPELREELGKDYLDNLVIIASETQLRETSLLGDNPCYMPLIISEISDELTKKITPHEALVGKINVLHGSKTVTGVFDKNFKDYTSSAQGIHAILVLDTLTESVKKMNILNNKLEFIKENNLKNIDSKFLEPILTDIHPLTTKYGSIEPLKNLNPAVDIPVENKILYFNHKGYDIFFFNGNSPFVVYHGDRTKRKSSIELLHSSNRPEIIDALVKNEFLKIDKENIFSALEAIAKESLKEQAKDSSNLTGFHFYRLFKKFKDNPGVMGNLDKANWYLLRDASYGNIEFSSLPLEIKERITKPSNKAVESYLTLLKEKTSEA